MLVYFGKGDIAVTAIFIMKTTRNIVLTLTISATLIICGFMNISAGYAFCCLIEVDSQKYIELFNSMGTGLLLSSLFLIIAVVIAFFKKMWIPLILNIIGSGFYIYTVSKLYAIPNTELPETVTEPLAERHLLTIIVTLLLIVLVILNYFDETNVTKRTNAKKKHIEQNERTLTSDEMIL